jgi:hypothetical protein
VFRVVIYLFVVYDVLFISSGVIGNGSVSPDLYQPVRIARELHLPRPTPEIVETLRLILLTAAPLAVFGRFPRLLGTVVAVAFTWWQIINMSFGKVDHDHFALLVACWLLATVSRCRFDDRSPCEASGWSLRCVQVAVVSTYFLSAWAKMRWGGWNWATGATTYWAVERRGNGLSKQLLDYPDLLRYGQTFMLAAEFLSPLMLFLRRWWLLAAVLFWTGFHVITYFILGIHFLPTMVCLLAFLPLEKVTDRLRRRPAKLKVATAA